MEFYEYESIKDRVRRLRKDMTDSVKRVWSIMKGKQIFRLTNEKVDNLYATDQKLRGVISGRFEEIAAKEWGLYRSDI